MKAQINLDSVKRLNNGRAKGHALAMKRGTYLVEIVDEDTGRVVYPSVPAYSAVEIVRILNAKGRVS